MDKRIYSLLGTIGASPYMTGAKRLNSQYARVEKLCEQKSYAACAAACASLFEQLLCSLYAAVTGDEESVSVILSDISFWDEIGDEAFCETAGMLHYACCRLTDEPENEPDPGKASALAKSGLDRVIGCTARFLEKKAKQVCLDPMLLKRNDVREQIRRLTDSLCERLEAASCDGGLSMQPPFMNVVLLDFPEREIEAWARYVGAKLKRRGLLSSAELGVLDAEQVVVERVGLTNEFIRRAAAGANGGVLLIEHFEGFDMPCLGGNLMDRALKTILTAADTYRGSLCIVVTGEGENAEKAFLRAPNAGTRFPLVLTLRQE